MKRGDVCFVEHDFRIVQPDGSLSLRKKDHPLLLLLAEDVASACGMQIGLFGTLSARVSSTGQQTGRRLADLRVLPFEFESKTLWFNFGDLESSIWKVHSIVPVTGLDDAAVRGAVNDDRWERKLSKLVHALLSQDRTIEALLPATKRTTRHIHPVLTMLRPGAIARYQGTEVMVLSHERFNQSHPYGVAIVAPVIRESRVQRGPVVGTNGLRVAYERAQAIEPFAQDAFAVV